MPNNNAVTPNFWKEKITDTLDMTGGKKRLHLASRKIDVNQDIFHLVIGLGGSGLTALLETKGLIEQTCKNSSSRVAYLALDTSKGDLDDYKSSPETGEVSLNDQEKGLMSDTDLQGLFAPHNIGRTLKNYPELFTWADERINPTGNQTGASGTRQIARLVLTKNYSTLINSIAEKIRALTTDVVMVQKPQLYVYVVAGIAGGTGSGTFMDIPYLVRDAVYKAGYNKSTQVFGYIFTPDVNFGNGASEDMLKRNGYAALQELDYNLQIPDMSETMNIYYPGKTYTAGGAGDRFFDKIHMVSSVTDQNVPIGAPLAHGSRVIAQNILSFVANEQVTAGKAFTVSDYYSNIDRIADVLIGGLTDPHRFHKYIAIGSAEFELPIDDIMMYVATLMFEKMDEMIATKPNAADIDQEERVLQMNMGSLFESLKAQVPFASTLPQPKSFDALVDDQDYWLKQSQTAFENIRAHAATVASQAIEAVVKDRTEKFNDRMRDMFLDPKKGPSFVNGIIHYGKIDDGLLDRLLAIRNELQTKWLARTPQNCPALSGLVQSYRNLTSGMRQGLPILGRADEKVARTNNINATGSQIYATCVQLAMAELLDKVCDRLYKYIDDKNDKLFNMVMTVLECMNSTFKENGEILTNGDLEVKPGAKTYTWGPLDVPVISHFVRERFDKIIGPRTNDLIGDFVKKLWGKADDWVMQPNQFDPVSFVSEFIDVEFNGIAQISIEDILTDLLSVPGTPGNLQSGINNRLMPWLEGQSRPLYSPANRNDNVVYPVWRLISVPANCQNVYNFVEQFCQNTYNNNNNNGYNLQKSNLRTRIYMQTVTCALPLSEFNIVEQFEDVYARMRDLAEGSEGLHLVHNVNSPHGRLKKTWNDLYTLIPKCSRPNVEYSPQVRRLINEENERKQMFRDLIEANSPMMRLNRPNNAIWSLDVDITTPILRIKEDQLQWVQVIDETKNAENVLKTWNCSGTPQQIEAVQNELTALKAGGLRQLPQSDVRTRIVNGTLINDGITGALDENRTWDYLLENCQCRLELVYDVRAEKTKYEALDIFLDMLENAYNVELDKQMDAEMGDFAKLLINGDLELGSDIVTQNHYFKIRDYNGIPLDLDLKWGSNFDTVETCFKLYQGYQFIMNSQAHEDVPFRNLLLDRLNAINDSMGHDISTMDIYVKENLLAGIERVNAAGKLGQLRIMPGVSEDIKKFYEKLNSTLDILKRLLDAPEAAYAPVERPVVQAPIVRRRI